MVTVIAGAACFMRVLARTQLNKKKKKKKKRKENIEKTLRKSVRRERGSAGKGP